MFYSKLSVQLHFRNFYSKMARVSLNEYDTIRKTDSDKLEME